MRRTIREKEPDRPSTKVSTLGSEELTTTAKRRGLDAPKLVNVLRGDLDWIVMKCLEKDRARRYETANGLASDIQRHLKNEPVVACPPSNLYRFQKLVRRNKLVFAAGAGIAAALVIGLAIALWQSIEKTRAYHRAAAAEKAAQTEAAKSHQVAHYLEDVLQDLGPSVALVHEPAVVRGILDRASERIDRDLANQPETAIELRETLAAIYGELGLFDKMEELARKNLDLARSTFGAENLVVANALSQLGEAQFFHEKLGEAETFIREALRIRRKLIGNEHLDVARSLRRLGNIAIRRTNVVEVEAVFREGLAICGKLAGEKTLVEADLLDGLAVALRQMGRRQEAEAISRQSLDIKRKILGNEHPSVADALEVLAMVLGEEGMALNDEGKLAEAEALNRERLDMCQKLFGKDHWRTGKALADMGGTLATRGRLVEAESLLRQGLAMHRKPLGNDDAGRMWRMWTLGSLERVLRQQGKLGDAKTTLRDAIELFRNEADAGDKASQNRLAWYLATYPDPEVRDGRSAVTYAEKAVAATSRANASYLDTLAAAYAESGDFVKAVTVQTEAMALLDKEIEKKDYASRLKLYESGSPYHEPE
jgi:Flp pilus assembly protein TadD